MITLKELKDFCNKNYIADDVRLVVEVQPDVYRSVDRAVFDGQQLTLYTEDYDGTVV